MLHWVHSSADEDYYPQIPLLTKVSKAHYPKSPILIQKFGQNVLSLIN